MKAVSILAIVIALFVSQPAATPPAKTRAPRLDEASQKINALQKERRDTLQQLVKLVQQRHRAGAVSSEAVLRASLKLNQAELDLAENRQRRIAVRKETVELLRRLEKTAKQRFEIGAGSQDEVLEARAARLQAEIELLREHSAK